MPESLQFWSKHVDTLVMLSIPWSPTSPRWIFSHVYLLWSPLSCCLYYHHISNTKTLTITSVMKFWTAQFACSLKSVLWPQLKWLSDFGLSNLCDLWWRGACCSWHDSRKVRSDSHHSGTLLQDRPCHRSPQVLPQLDDQSGCGFAMDRWSEHNTVSGNGYNKNHEWRLSESGCLAKWSHEICKSARFLKTNIQLYIHIASLWRTTM